MRTFINKIKNMFIYWSLCFKFKRLRKRDEMSFVMIDTNKMFVDIILVEMALVKSGYKLWQHQSNCKDRIIYIKSDMDPDKFYDYIQSLRSKEMLADDDTLYTVYRV